MHDDSICDDFVHVSAQDAECARCVFLVSRLENRLQRRIESEADLNLLSKKNIAAVCNLLAAGRIAIAVYGVARALNCI
jgi:hypothetical protein